MQPSRQQKSAGIWWRVAVLAAGLGMPLVCRAQSITFIYPSADAFVRAAAPNLNYGAAGSLSVSGSAAVNGNGDAQGESDSLMRFSMADLAASMNSQYGSNGWAVSSVVLNGTENAMPNNPIFNRGVGAFEIRWLATNNWVEGDGTPNMMTSDGVVYQDVAGLLNPALDRSLGQFTNSGANAGVSFSLALAGPLVSNIVAGADVDLYLTPVSPTVGFTFNSKNYILSNAWPTLQITAVPNLSPRISSITLTGSNQVAIRFNTASNWTYIVQGSGGVGGGGWSNLSTNVAEPFDDQGVFMDTVTNAQRFYRLSVFQP